LGVYVLGSVTGEDFKNKKLAPFDFGERSQVWGDEVVVGKGPEPDAATGPNN
jgi:hypothetical protein